MPLLRMVPLRRLGNSESAVAPLARVWLIAHNVSQVQGQRAPAIVLADFELLGGAPEPFQCVRQSGRVLASFTISVDLLLLVGEQIAWKRVKDSQHIV